MNPVSATGVCLTGGGAYLLGYFFLIARTGRGQDPARNVFAEFNQKHARTIARTGRMMLAAGVVLLGVGLVM